MQDLKQTIGRNIGLLRNKAHLTQAELASQLNYTDKAISKWERGESVPDIATLKQIADWFGVSVDYLLEEHEENDPVLLATDVKTRKRNHLLISLIAIAGVFGVSVLVFSVAYAVARVQWWQSFIVAIPVSSIVALVLNSVWGKRRFNYLIISVLIWSILLTLYIFLLKYNPWTVFLLGIPGQICVFLSSKIRIVRKNPSRPKPERWN